MRKQAILLLSMLVQATAWGQSSTLAYPHVSVMTPEASSLAKYSDIPVSYYTGVPNISIPLYTIRVDDFELPITLNYHSSGIRVDQEATCVGLGWSLSAGGRVTRTAKGIDDFREYGYDPNYPYYKKGYYEAPDVPNNAPNTTMYEHYNYDNGSGTPSIGNRKIIDTEPDIFYYDIPGYSGKFIIDKSRGAVLFDRSHNLRVEVRRESSQQGVVLKITDPDGNQFFFNKKEHSRNYTSNTWLNKNGTVSSPKYDDNPEDFTVWTPTIRNGEGEQEYEPSMCDPYRMCSSWCLTSIVTRTGRTITLTYTAYNEYLPTQESTEVYNNRHSGNQFYYKSKVVNEGWQLTGISWDFGSVELTNSAREDIKGTAKKVDRIKVYDNSRIVLKSYLFNYSYFNNDYSGEDKYKHVFKRLRLLSLQEQNSGEKHQFSYYEGSFPAKNSKNVDYWGMQNGRNYGAQYQIGITVGANTYGGVRKTANYAHAVIGMLRQIQYPTGGYARFTYECNDVSSYYSITNDNTATDHYTPASYPSGKGGGLRIAGIETDSGTRTFTYSGSKTLTEPTFYYYGNRAGDGSYLEECTVQVSESRTPLSAFNNGNVVGYDRVEETLESDGVTSSTRYYYHNEVEERYDDNPKFAYSPVEINYHNGLLQKVEYYGDDNLLKEENYTYQTNYGNYIFAMTDFGGKYNTDEILTYNYRLQWPLKSRCIVREFDNGQTLSDTCNFVYNGRDLLSRKVHRVNGKSYSEHYKYPFDFSDNISLSMVRNNTIKQPAETFYSVDGKVYSGTKTEYLDSTKWFMPAQVYRLETRNGVSEQSRNGYYASYVQYEKYGPYGTLRQIRDKGVVTSYIWGYKYQFPIAVVANAEYSTLESTLGGGTRVNSFSAVPNPSDEGVRMFLQPLLPLGNYNRNATIYSYKQLVGPTSVTRPDGVCTYYEYDSAGRLVRVRDTHGMLKKTYTYHYKQ
ncbi:MAG: RHS repeat protein [Prevotella sp.]|nr:RHS repeat protein [Prevotella sp.]